MRHAHPRSTEPTRSRRAQRSRGSSRRSEHRRREGAAALEFALILPLFVFLVLGIVDFGHMLFVVNTITNAAREGARRGVVQRLEADVESAAVAGATLYLDAAGIRGSSTTATLGGSDVVVTVTIDGYRNISGFTYNLPGLSATALAGPRDLSSVATMRWEFFTP